MKHYFLIFSITFANAIDLEKMRFCAELNCTETNTEVCGIREEGDGFRLKLFKSECRLLRFGCSVDESKAYGIINMDYCTEAFSNNTTKDERINTTNNNVDEKQNDICANIHCNISDITEICGIRTDGPGYRVRLFTNKCELLKLNCIENLEFVQTDLFICKSTLKEIKEDNNIAEQIETIKNIIIINGGMFGNITNINDTIDSFFAATHVFDLPMKEIDPFNTRRRLIKNAGPVKIFVPLIEIPKEKMNDTYHQPTLSSCYHKCPKRCPDTYSPVCGVPGIVAREPALMFKNHCFMDVAQCKMFWENKSSTSHSSSYIESSFLFCMGDEMNALFRFLPTIRTLQRMGRLKKKGKFRVKLKNLRFLNEFRSGRPNFMG